MPMQAVRVMEPKGYVAFDLNERGLDGVMSDGQIVRYNLLRIRDIRHGYFERARKVQAKYAGDRRV